MAYSMTYFWHHLGKPSHKYHGEYFIIEHWGDLLSGYAFCASTFNEEALSQQLSSFIAFHALNGSIGMVNRSPRSIGLMVLRVIEALALATSSQLGSQE